MSDVSEVTEVDRPRFVRLRASAERDVDSHPCTVPQDGYALVRVRIEEEEVAAELFAVRICVPLTAR